MDYARNRMDSIGLTQSRVYNVGFLTDGNIAARHLRRKQTKAMPLAANIDDMKIKTVFFVLMSMVFLMTSCSKTQRFGEDFPATNDSYVVSVIPVETAIDGLNSFLKEMGVETKGESAKTIASIETHYSESTRNDNGETIPDVYLVNYNNDEGYALLGANSSVTPIIAVIDHGNA